MNLAAHLSLKTGGFMGPLSGAQSALGGFVGMLRGVMAPLAALAGAGTIAGLGLKSISSAMDAENLQVDFATMMRSAKKAEETIASLTNFAKSTPFEMPEVVTSARSLLAFGTEAGALESTLRKVGDVASGVGAPLKEIADIYGKARINGKLFNEDINQLTGRGIPVIQEFAAQLGVSEDQVRKLSEEGKIGFGNLEKAFESLTSAGGIYHGLMEAKSRTSRGLWDNLKDSIAGVGREFGKPINDAIKPMLQGAGSAVEKLQAGAGAAGAMVAQTFGTLRNLFGSGEVGELLRLSLKIGFDESINYGRALLNASVQSVGILLATHIQQALTMFEALKTPSFWQGVGNALKGVFLGTMAVIGRVLASTFESLGNTRGLGFLKDGAERLRNNADRNEEEARTAFSASGEQLAPTFEKIVKNAVSGAREIGAAYVDSLANVKSVSGKDRASVMDIIRRNVPGLATPSGEAEEGGGGRRATSATGAAAEKFGKAGTLSDGDRLAKIGLMVGNGNMDHQRRTAENTSRLVTGILKITGLMTNSLNRNQTATTAVFAD